MSHTAEFFASEEAFKTTKAIFHGPLDCSAGHSSPAGKCDTRFSEDYRTGINPVTFEESSQLCFGAGSAPEGTCSPAPAVHPAWFKAYRSEQVDEYQNPGVRCYL